MSGRYRTHDGSFEGTSFNQVRYEQGDDFVGRQVRAVRINDSEAVRIPVSGQTQINPAGLGQFHKFGQIPFLRLRSDSSKERIALHPQRDNLHPGLAQDLTDVVAAGSVHGIIAYFETRFSDGLEVHQTPQ